MSDSLLHLIALTLVPQIGPVQAKNLLQQLTPEEIFRASPRQLQRIEGIGVERANAIHTFRSFDRAALELAFLEKRGIQAIPYNHPAYPQRLLHCYDPPVLLYYAGTASLNPKRVLAIIGTRLPTEQGKEHTERIVEELQDQEITVVSGLAAGIDAIAHRSALRNRMPTIGVLAHGLDRIYPHHHRKLAKEMEGTGGLLTEFPHGTDPDRYHFPARNRIVAGMTDATLVIESGEKGGSLITVSLANQYNRDVFALPGRLQDEKSKGCLQLIKQHQADIFTSTTDMLQALGWLNTHVTKPTMAPTLFPELNELEQKIVDALKEGSTHQDQLGWRLDLSASVLNSALFQLEMKSVIVSLPGKQFRLRS